MSSIASRAAQKIRKGISNGQLPLDAMDAALRTYSADVALGLGSKYARFQDKSYLKLLNFTTPQVVEHHTSKTDAEKIIDNIHAYCSECDKEIWCYTSGKTLDSETFDLAGTKIPVCESCQRNIVTRSLLGEG